LPCISQTNITPSQQIYRISNALSIPARMSNGCTATVPVYSLFNNMTPALQRHLMMKLMVLLPLLPMQRLLLEMCKRRTYLAN